jgi:hypothetical protein
MPLSLDRKCFTIKYLRFLFGDKGIRAGGTLSSKNYRVKKKEKGGVCKSALI